MGTIRNRKTILFFIVALFLFKNTDAFSAGKMKKIPMGEIINVDFLKHKDVLFHGSDSTRGIYAVNSSVVHVTDELRAYYITYTMDRSDLILAGDYRKKNPNGWEGCMLAIPKPNTFFGQLLSNNQKCDCDTLEALFADSRECVENFDLYMYYIPYDQLYCLGTFYFPDYYEYELKKEGVISILKYENDVWEKIGETWEEGGNWRGPCEEDAKNILFKRFENIIQQKRMSMVK